MFRCIRIIFRDKILYIYIYCEFVCIATQTAAFGVHKALTVKNAVLLLGT